MSSVIPNCHDGAQRSAAPSVIFAIFSGITHLQKPFMCKSYVDPTQLQQWRSNISSCSILFVLTDLLSNTDNLRSGRYQRHKLGELSPKVMYAVLVYLEEYTCFCLFR